jgi:hypothetical protein
MLSAGLVEVGTMNDIEVNVLERRRHVIGVMRRVGQVGDVHIGAIADDERNAFLGLCMPRHDATKKKNKSESETVPPAHAPRPDVIKPGHE